jgi:predicted membrane protein
MLVIFYLYIYVIIEIVLIKNLLLIADFLKLFFTLSLLYIFILLLMVYKLSRESTNTIFDSPSLVRETISVVELAYLRECFYGDFWCVLLVVKNKESR